ncbi:hypothetical protein [Olleya sp. Bg11-27]|uniref:hypothetical protein n=1 Tax=Olleya sp. Bg11-27 TaxID=2058135 RepID=UPI000C301E95|nr:hypothetical protein [Olleya sp. Bg11-27]AUC75765.1 hypothetical protein CW732_08780 [Olleya sp. Bg11-27]
MNPLLEYIKAQKPELAEVITVINTMQSQQQEDTIDVTNTDHIQDDNLILNNTVKDTPNSNQTKALKMEILKLKRLVKFLKQEVINESEINHDFALAVGACTDCFGCDEDCSHCSGNGQPGFFVPDFIHYKELIIPAQKKYNLHFKTNNNY